MTHILPFGLCKRAPQKQLLNVYQEAEQRSVYTNWSKGHWGCGSIQIDTSWQSCVGSCNRSRPWARAKIFSILKQLYRLSAATAAFIHPPMLCCVFVYLPLSIHPCCSKFFLLEGLTREQRRKGAPTTSLPPLLPHPPTVCNNRSPSLSSQRGAAVYFIFAFLYLCVFICIVIHPPTVLPTEASLSLPQRSSCQPSYGSVYGSTSSHPYFSNQTPQFHAPVKDFCLTVPFLLIACNSQPR